MKPIVPGRFNGATISSEGGEIELRLSDVGNWQLKAKASGETDWRLLCTGNLDGSVFAPPLCDDEAPIRLGPLWIDFVHRAVEVRGVPVQLTALEFELLATLASDPGRLFPRSEILRKIWGCDHVSRNKTLQSHASQLRCKLRRAGANGYVLNSRSLGYKLCEGSIARKDPDR